MLSYNNIKKRTMVRYCCVVQTMLIPYEEKVLYISFGYCTYRSTG